MSQVDSSSNLVSSSSNRFFWIRISLFEKKLHKIVAFLVKNSEKWGKITKISKMIPWEKETKILRTRYYEAGRSVVGDPDLGQILASLIGQLEFGFKYDRRGNIVQNDLHYKL